MLKAAREPSQRDGEAKRDLATIERVVAGIVPLIGTPGASYLRDVRRIDLGEIGDVLSGTDAIGWNEAVCFNQPGHSLHGQRLGCIVGIMTDPTTGRPTGAISRTYLDGNLRKIGKAKSLGKGGGVIRLTQDEDVLEGLHLAEGLESALAALESWPPSLLGNGVGYDHGQISAPSRN